MKPYELVIKAGQVMDPASDFEGMYNIGITDGRITTLTLDQIDGVQEIDATGLVVAPGFVDIHTHVDGLKGAGQSLARLGVTTAIGGNCGSLFWMDKDQWKALTRSKDGDLGAAIQSEEDLGSLLERIDQEGYPVNLGMLIGAWALRQKIGAGDRFAPAERDQVAQLVDLAEDAMLQGAFGVSFGLAYAPGTSQKELVELFKVAARYDGIAAVHPRYHAWGLPGVERDAVAGEMELIEAASISGVKLQIAHIAHQIAFKARPYDALTKRGLEVIDQARDEGVDVTADCVPSVYSGALISQPFLDIFLSPAFEKHTGIDIGDALKVARGPYKGERLDKALFVQIREEAPNTPLTLSLIKEDLMIRTLIPPYVMVSSDVVSEGFPAQPLVLGRLVRELRVVTLMEALYKMSTLPALRLGLLNKGRIAVGADADIVIFDPHSIQGVYEPTQDPCFDVEGIDYVIVNGVPVVHNGELSDVTPGKALRNQPWS